MNAQLSMWRRMRGSADIASCRQVTHFLQSYLDGQTDQGTARRVSRHVEACRRCGLEATAYQRIKDVVGRQYPMVADPAAVRRLKEFAGQLTNRE
jgi:anti-sigma factor RsiW